MTEDEAVRILREMYRNAPYREKALSIHLFGIKYADRLSSLNLKVIAEQATGYESYHTEIHKGIRLSKYVRPRDDLA